MHLHLSKGAMIFRAVARYLMIGAVAAVLTGMAALVGYSVQQFYSIAIHPLT